MLVAPVVAPRRASPADTGLDGDAAVITRPAGHIAPDDAVALPDRIAENIGTITGDFLDNAAGLMAGNDGQAVTAAQRAMPAMHVGTAQGGGGNLDQQRSGIEIGDLYLLNFKRFVMSGDNRGAAFSHCWCPPWGLILWGGNLTLEGRVLVERFGKADKFATLSASSQSRAFTEIATLPGG